MSALFLDAVQTAFAFPPSAALEPDEPAPPTAPDFLEVQGAPLAALAEEELSPRFFAWRGASGRRYIASIYEARLCPAYCDAALIAVAHDAAGRRRIIALADTGAFPEPVVARLAESLAPFAERLEFHLHLLATGADERRATLDDLAEAMG
ncbi:MAG: hypothetical protein E7774_07275 [Bradyrhizobium sp.]|nr:MAG: hypothetical protein E7774_07275 [Bradyrhizobium sp.]